MKLSLEINILKRPSFVRPVLIPKIWENRDNLSNSCDPEMSEILFLITEVKQIDVYSTTC